MRIHVFETGLLSGNRTFLRGESWRSLLRSRRPYEFPVYSFVVEDEDGLIAIDTGLGPTPKVPRVQRRVVPVPVSHSASDLPAQMRDAGLDPADVRTVLLTHLDWDHIGGAGHFPNAEVLVHRPDLEFARTRMGRLRFHPELWPAGLRPEAYDLDPTAFGPFPASRRLGLRDHLVVVGLPGHSPGQIGVVVETGHRRLFLAADHILRADWFSEDWDAGRLLGLGIFDAESARETSRRVQGLARDCDAVILPSHDTETPARLAAALGAGAGAKATVG